MTQGRTNDQNIINAYSKGWARTMVRIMQEQIDRLSIHRTGALRGSIRETVAFGNTTTIEHRFLEYGIYVALGVGNGYSKGNGGNLYILSPEYRSKHPNRQPRQRRDFFFRKYYASLHAISERHALHYGEAYQGLLSTFLQQQFDKPL